MPATYFEGENTLEAQLVTPAIAGLYPGDLQL